MKTHNKFTFITLMLVFFSVVVMAASKAAEQQGQEGLDPFKVIAVISGAFTGLAVIIGTLSSLFKSFRNWLVRKVRKALHIIDIEDFVEETTKRNQESLQAIAMENKSQFEAINKQNAQLGIEIKTLVDMVDKLRGCVELSQISDKAILREGITRIYYKYHRRRQITANERENVSQLHAAYSTIKINGDEIHDKYVNELYEEIKSWQIIYPEQNTGEIENARK